jgi:N utilization substance protein A
MLLFQNGWRGLRELAVADAEELASVPGIDTLERAEAIIEVANDAASGNIKLEVEYPLPRSEAAQAGLGGDE